MVYSEDFREIKPKKFLGKSYSYIASSKDRKSLSQYAKEMNKKKKYRIRIVKFHKKPKWKNKPIYRLYVS